MAEPTVIGTYKDTGTNLYKSSPTDIFVREDRHRQTFKRKPLDQLILSMQEVGQLQPGLCILKDDKIELLIGERRLKVCMVLGIEFEYILKGEIKDKLILEQMQLDENLCRDPLTWQDEIRAKARLHAILQKRFGAAKPGLPGGHGLKDTAEHIGAKLSALHNDVTLASFLEIDEVAAAPNKTTALKTVKTLIKNVKRQDDLAKALAKEDKPKEIKLSEEERADLKFKQKALEQKLVNETGMPQEKAAAEAQEWAERQTQETIKEKEEEQKKEERVTPKTEETSLVEKQLIYYNKKCLLGKMEDKFAEFPNEHFDIICFDPPWGVEFDKVFKNSGTTKQYQDSKEAFFAQFPDWIKLIYQKMKPDSHLYMFFGIGQTPEGEDIDESGEGFEAFRYRDYIYDVLHETGFKTNRMPLIWYKEGAHTTRNPLIWPGRSYEPIAYARKGAKPLALQGAPDVIITPMPTPSIKDIHPSAKHPQIYKELLERSAHPGDRIADPMGGSGMFGVAAEALQKSHALDWTMIEIDRDYRNLQLLNLVKGYDEITKTIRNQIPKIKEADKLEVQSYKELTPGTPEWMVWWKAHPEDQGGMIEMTKAHKQKKYSDLVPGTPEWATYWKANPEEHDEMLAWRQKTGR